MSDIKVLGIFKYGSSVYGTPNPKDLDLIFVLDTEEVEYFQEKICEVKPYGAMVDVTCYSKEEFERMLHMHHITALECYYLPKEYILYRDEKWWRELDFTLDLSQLRRSISATASNSFVKCKKKLTVQKDYNPYIGKKSMFHSIRILNFGTQIATVGKIYDYSYSNSILEEILSMDDDWGEIREVYQPIYNMHSSHFKLVAPK